MEFKLSFKDWNIERMTGYKPMTTCYMDFSIAEAFGESAVLETYESLMEQMKCDYRWLTEFVMALNWKIWEHYETNERLARLYDSLWEQAQNYACNNLYGDELNYFYSTTDQESKKISNHRGGMKYGLQ